MLRGSRSWPASRCDPTGVTVMVAAAGTLLMASGSGCKWGRWNKRMPDASSNLPPGCMIRAAALEEILPLRQRTFFPDKAIADSTYRGDELATTHHFAAVLGGHGRGGESLQVVAICTVMRADLEGVASWQLRGMTVDSDWRGRGLGRSLVDYALSRCRRLDANVDQIWLNSTRDAFGFYEHLGWELVEDHLLATGTATHWRMLRISD